MCIVQCALSKIYALLFSREKVSNWTILICLHVSNTEHFEHFAAPFQKRFILCFGSGFSESGPAGSRHFAQIRFLVRIQFVAESLSNPYQDPYDFFRTKLENIVSGHIKQNPHLSPSKLNPPQFSLHITEHFYRFFLQHVLEARQRAEPRFELGNT